MLREKMLDREREYLRTCAVDKVIHRRMYVRERKFQEKNVCCKKGMQQRTCEIEKYSTEKACSREKVHQIKGLLGKKSSSRESAQHKKCPAEKVLVGDNVRYKNLVAEMAFGRAFS
jgi:hypothetical protein